MGQMTSLVPGAQYISSIASAADPDRHRASSVESDASSLTVGNDRVSESAAVKTTEDSARVKNGDCEVYMEIDDDDDSFPRDEIQLDFDQKMGKRVVQGHYRVADDAEGFKGPSSSENSTASSSVSRNEIEMSTSNHIVQLETGEDVNAACARRNHNPTTLRDLAGTSEGVESHEEDANYRAGNFNVFNHQPVESGKDEEGPDDAEKVMLPAAKDNGQSPPSSSKITFAHYDSISKQCEKMSKEKVLVLPTVQNGIAFKSHRDFRMHHVVAARQRGWSSNVFTGYTKVNRFALGCSHGSNTTGPSCTYRIIVERQLINGNVVWIAVREKPHTSHTPSTVGKLGKYKTDAVESKGKDVELSDQEDSGLNAEAIQSDPNRERSRDKPTSPPTRFREKKRPRVHSISPPPQSRNAVASTSGSKSRTIHTSSSISHTSPGPVPQVLPLPYQL